MNILWYNTFQIYTKPEQQTEKSEWNDLGVSTEKQQSNQKESRETTWLETKGKQSR